MGFWFRVGKRSLILSDIHRRPERSKVGEQPVIVLARVEDPEELTIYYIFFAEFRLGTYWAVKRDSLLDLFEHWG
jgi:hypothetical protein